MKWSSSSSSLALDSLREVARCLRAPRWAEGLLALPSSSMLNMSSSSMISVAVLTTQCEWTGRCRGQPEPVVNVWQPC